MNAKPGDFANVNMKVTYPDGTTDTPSTTFVVGERNNNADADPSYPEKTVYPAEETTSPITVDKPDDIGFAVNDPFVIEPGENFTPTGETNTFGNPVYKVTTENGDWFVSLDENGNVITKVPETAKPGDSVNVPVKVTYTDGSFDMVTAPIVVVDNARQIPFETEYVFDPEIPAGKYEVREKGETGKEVLLRDETWSRVKEPVNEIVAVGTKPASSSENVTWTVPTNYPTIFRPNMDLKPGEIKTVQEGVSGEKTYTATFTATGSQANVAEEETTKEPVTEIVEYGPQIEDTVLTSTTTQQVPFQIEYISDDTLEAGQQEIVTQGVPGEETITAAQNIVDGKPSGEPVINIERTQEPVNMVVRIGTRTSGEVVNTVEAQVPFEVDIEFDPDMEAGTSEVVTPGKPGKRVITTTHTINNSQAEGEPTVQDEIVEEPVNQVIKVGTKPSEASSQVEWSAQIPFAVEMRVNPDLKPGEVVLVQKGVPGEKVFSADFTAKGNEATVTPVEKETLAPVNEVYEYGPGLEDGEVVTVVKSPVPFETVIEFDASLGSGEQEIVQQGQFGEDTVTSTQKLVDGKADGDPVVTSERTREPVKQIIHVGCGCGEGTPGSSTEETAPVETPESSTPDSTPAETLETSTPESSTPDSSTEETAPVDTPEPSTPESTPAETTNQTPTNTPNPTTQQTPDTTQQQNTQTPPTTQTQTNNGLAKTGVNVALILLASILVLLAGMSLLLFRNKKN